MPRDRQGQGYAGCMYDTRLRLPAAQDEST
jgi:hypothetical protein